MQRWLLFQPYSALLQSDFYYLKLCNEIYGSYLPFFDSDPEEYYPDEINPEDLRFLLWYYLSMVHDDTTISPTIYEWSELSEEIFEILEREYESAP